MTVHLSDEQPLDVDSVPLRFLAERVLSDEGYPALSDVSVILVTDDVMAEYNSRFLGRTGPTDVLAFPLEDLRPGRPPKLDVDGPPVHLGDVVIAPAYVGRQSEVHGTSVAEEMSLMLVHGVLHLMGFDHEQDDEAEAMEERERRILGRIGMNRR